MKKIVTEQKNKTKPKTKKSMDQLNKGLDKAEQITDRLGDRYEEIAKGTALRDKEMENTKHRKISTNVVSDRKTRRKE